MLRRSLRNLFGGWFRLSRWFPREAMQRIRDAISASELGHSGEICFAVESRYSLGQVLDGLQPRARAQQVFAQLRVWDTENNSGVLLYLQLAERRCELVADRGITARVPQARWDAIMTRLIDELHHLPPERAVLDAIGDIGALLAEHFPASADNPRELSDEPVIL